MCRICGIIPTTVGSLLISIQPSFACRFLEHSHKCMYDFHQKREGDRDLVCGDVREGGRERERERGRERRCEDAKMRRCEDNIRRCENEKL